MALGATAAVPGLASAAERPDHSVPPVEELTVVTETEQYVIYRAVVAGETKLVRIDTAGRNEGHVRVVERVPDEASIRPDSAQVQLQSETVSVERMVSTQGVGVTERVKNIERSIGDCDENVCGGGYDHQQTGFSVEFTKPVEVLADRTVPATIGALASYYFSGPVGWGASIIAGFVFSFGGRTFTISPFDKDERGDVLFWTQEPVVVLGVSGSWNSDPGELLETKEEDGEHIVDWGC